MAIAPAADSVNPSLCVCLQQQRACLMVDVLSQMSLVIPLDRIRRARTAHRSVLPCHRSKRRALPSPSQLVRALSYQVVAAIKEDAELAGCRSCVAE